MTAGPGQSAGQRRRARAAAALLGCLPLLACLAQPPASPADGTAAPAVVEVTIHDYSFDPAMLRVRAGTTVRWVNREKRTSHSVLFTGEAGLESERLFPDETWQRRFEKPGVYAYTCGPHPEMQGRIEVTE